MKAIGPITDALWQGSLDLIDRLKECAFVQQLTDGTLPMKAFHHYLAQDALYLKDDNKALLTISERAEEEDLKSFFKTIAEDGIAIEEVLQTEYFECFGIQRAEAKSMAVMHYTDHLLKQAQHSELPIALAATLPCFWVYNTIGNEIYKKAKSPNPFQKWIDTYQGAEYESFTIRFIELCEALGQKASPEIQQEMQIAFRKSTECELAFFEESIKV
jgi:thiaminase/transcriptional activator TenA